VIDPYYTPPELAQVMVDLVPSTLNPKVIADFAAGEGSLLHAALKKWPKASVYANDLAPTVSRRLQRQNPCWKVSCTDFLSSKSTSRAKYCSKQKQIDLVLINPPFSERGRSPVSWRDMGFDFNSGIATAFLYKALAYVSATGTLVAVLPDGCLTSVRDELAWRTIRQSFDVEVIRDNSSSAFKGVCARTSVVRIHRHKFHSTSIKSSVPFPIPESNAENFNVVRGKLGMHEIRKKQYGNTSLPLIHSSQLLGGEVNLMSAARIIRPASITGAAVLFPRVGRVTPEKVGVLAKNIKVVLSDCVLGIECSSEQEAKALRDEIIRQWPIFAQAYRGTGAPYITVNRAIEVLSPIVISARATNIADSEEPSQTIGKHLEV
jgi:predicted RNA methylase